MGNRVTTLARFALLCTCFSFGVAAVGRAQSFDVTSIRPQAPGDNRFGVKLPNEGRFSSTGTVAKLLIMVAYDVQESQIAGGPSWSSDEKWDIEARSEDQQSSPEATRRMLQSMLQERFKLRVHGVTEERPAYVLTVGRGGVKFKEEGDGALSNVQVTRNSIRLQSGEIARMAQVLSTSLGRPVVDQTGLTGHYDLAVQWEEAPIREGGVPGLDTQTSATGGGSIFTAIQDQLGLRLESRRLPVEVLVIDGMERPSQN